MGIAARAGVADAPGRNRWDALHGKNRTAPVHVPVPALRARPATRNRQRQNDVQRVVIAPRPASVPVLANNGGDVFDRGEGAFDGLHILLGYGAITFGNTEEGQGWYAMRAQAAP